MRREQHVLLRRETVPNQFRCGPTWLEERDRVARLEWHVAVTEACHPACAAQANAQLRPDRFLGANREADHTAPPRGVAGPRIRASGPRKPSASARTSALNRTKRAP